jgi:hypothetical protein
MDSGRRPHYEYCDTFAQQFSEVLICAEPAYHPCYGSRAQ